MLGLSFNDWVNLFHRVPPEYKRLVLVSSSLGVGISMLFVYREVFTLKLLARVGGAKPFIILYIKIPLFS